MSWHLYNLKNTILSIKAKSLFLHSVITQNHVTFLFAYYLDHWIFCEVFGFSWSFQLPFFFLVGSGNICLHPYSSYHIIISVILSSFVLIFSVAWNLTTFLLEGLMELISYFNLLFLSLMYSNHFLNIILFTGFLGVGQLFPISYCPFAWFSLGFFEYILK